MVANVDYTFIVTALNEDYSYNRIARYVSVVLQGHSIPVVIMRTSSVRESDSTGRHTTTYRQLIELNNGVSIIDTPGMREIGMANTELGIDNTFSDIAKLEKQCKFSDCQHDTEPGCAVKAAIERGDLSVDRYILYKSLSSENTKNYAKKKEISKWAKAAKKIKRDSF
jgi:ribosome biogenesis GTPase